MSAQAAQVCFTYARFLTEAQLDLAAKISSITPPGLDRVFFVSGGSEATESALKMARKYHLATGNPKKHKVISRWQSWHGNTIGALSMSGRSPWRDDYVPYLLDFPHISPSYSYRCPYCRDCGECRLECAAELERTIEQEGSEYISAFIAEPVLGTSAAGVAPPEGYFPMIREICDRHNILMIVDEVVTGFGRTGVNFAIEHWDVIPDIMATGKGLSSGYTPIAATIAHDRIYDAIYAESTAFVHGHTYGGNPPVLRHRPGGAGLPRRARPGFPLRPHGGTHAGEDRPPAGTAHRRRGARQGPAHRGRVRRRQGTAHSLRPRCGGDLQDRRPRFRQGSPDNARCPRAG